MTCTNLWLQLNFIGFFFYIGWNSFSRIQTLPYFIYDCHVKRKQHEPTKNQMLLFYFYVQSSTQGHIIIDETFSCNRFWVFGNCVIFLNQKQRINGIHLFDYRPLPRKRELMSHYFEHWVYKLIFFEGFMN